MLIPSFMYFIPYYITLCYPFQTSNIGRGAECTLHIGWQALHLIIPIPCHASTMYLCSCTLWVGNKSTAVASATFIQSLDMPWKLCQCCLMCNGPFRWAGCHHLTLHSARDITVVVRILQKGASRWRALSATQWLFFNTRIANYFPHFHRHSVVAVSVCMLPH